MAIQKNLENVPKREMIPEKDLMAYLLDKKFKSVLKLLTKLKENVEKVKKKLCMTKWKYH